MTYLKPILALSLFALTACGGDSSSTQKNAPQTQSTRTAPPKAAPVTTNIQTTATPATKLSESDALFLRGEKLFKRCHTCHTVEEEGRHKVGPNLWGIYGRTAGTREAFAYSNAMKESGIVWDDETLDAYINNPRDFMPDNRMTFVGLRKQDDRDAVLNYLKIETSPKAAEE